jgi:KDO2-lipid IV(A) lauroyltransferase
MKSKLLYYCLIAPISRLPYWMIYGVSHLLYVVLYQWIGYRKKVVRKNIERVFADHTPAWRLQLERDFYRHFCDLICETVKQFHISQSDAEQRMKHLNTAVFAPFAQKGQSVIIAGGHMGNWELWGVSAALAIPHEIIGVYKRLSDPFFDQKLRSSRGKWGTKLVATKEIAQYLKDHVNDLKATVLAIDQSPANPQKAYWTSFLGQETACYFGPEKLAQEWNMPIVYGHIVKTKRGHYETTYEVVCEDPQQMGYGQIIELLNQKLEADILAHPHLWLWSHKRWKHQKPMA